MTVHDVFISYAHADNEIPRGTECGWVTSMVDALRQRVRQIRGESTSQVDGVELSLVTSGAGVPTSALLLAKE